MELWEAVEVYMNREVDFTSEVIILYDQTEYTLRWNIVGTPAPTNEELNILMAQDPLIKIKYDVNGFIWDYNKGVIDIPSETGYTILTLNHAKLEGDIVENIYNLPHYRYHNGEIIQITDYSIYQLDAHLWERFNSKLDIEIHDIIHDSTNDELKAIYDTSPQYKKDAIYRGIQYFWASKIPQWNMNITFEIMLRLFVEKYYIESVEQRSLTSDELSAFNSAITIMQGCNNMLKNSPSEEGDNIATDHWFLMFLQQMSGSCDLIRQYEFAQRVYVTGGV